MDWIRQFHHQKRLHVKFWKTKLQNWALLKSEDISGYLRIFGKKKSKEMFQECRLFTFREPNLLSKKKWNRK